MRVLIAEDEPTGRLTLQRAIEQLGHEVLGAADGGRAWELLRTHPVDVIISDWAMPEVDGPTLCRRVRAATHLPYIYFILLTIHNDAEHVVDGLRSGADDYLLKPVSLDDLRARLLGAERIVVLHSQLAEQGSRYKRLQSLSGAGLRTARLISAEADPALAVDHLIQEAVQLVGADRGGVYRPVPGSSQWLPMHSALNPRDEVEFGNALGGLHAASESAEAGTPFIVHADRASKDGQAVLAAIQAQSAILAPMHYQGRFLGDLILACTSESGDLQTEDAETLELLTALAAPAVASAAASADNATSA